MTANINDKVFVGSALDVDGCNVRFDSLGGKDLRVPVEHFCLLHPLP
jgi:hypothetical protein